jgi:hypothetical protein
MNRGWLRYMSSVAVLLAAMNFLSCGNKLKLVSIAVHPTSFTFLTPDPTGKVDFTALGTYMHPPDTRDISSRVTWKTDSPNFVQFNGSEVSQTGTGCGVGTVSASLNDGGNLIIGYATVTVDDPTNPLCPGGNTTQAIVGVTPGGPGTGTVSSVPAGIACPTTCGAQFTVGDTILLTATPTGTSTFGGWGTGCTTVSGNMCSITVPTGSTNVTATFN